MGNAFSLGGGLGSGGASNQANAAPLILGGGARNGGTSNQTHAAFQIGRARRSNEQARMRSPWDNQKPRMSLATYANRILGARRSLEALEDWQDNPFGPTLRKEVAEDRLQDREQISRFGRVGIGRWNMESRKDRELNRVQGIGPRK